MADVPSFYKTTLIGVNGGWQDWFYSLALVFAKILTWTINKVLGRQFNISIK